MIKTITKVGNSPGIVFDGALLDLAQLKVGDHVNVEVHDGGTITLTPVHPVISPAKAGAVAKKLIRKNRELFRRLS